MTIDIDKLRAAAKAGIPNKAILALCDEVVFLRTDFDMMRERLAEIATERDKAQAEVERLRAYAPDPF